MVGMDVPKYFYVLLDQVRDSQRVADSLDAAEQLRSALRRWIDRERLREVEQLYRDEADSRAQTRVRRVSFDQRTGDVVAPRRPTGRRARPKE